MKAQIKWVLWGGAAIVLALFAYRCDQALQPTEILVTVVSVTPVDELVLRGRNLEGDQDTLTVNVAGRDLSLDAEPYHILVRPSNIASDGPEGFLLHVQGRVDGQTVASRGRILHFVPDTRIEEIISIEEYLAAADADQDGFPDCRNTSLDAEQRAICDCADQNPYVNVFVPEVCGDGRDNNCTGYPPDEGCPCTEGQVQVCTTLREDQLQFAGVGACRLGELRCINGQFSTVCEGAGVPSPEVCGNDIDDDCDGTADEGCQCSSNRECLLGLVGQEASERAVGVCRTGIQRCINGLYSNECEGEVRPLLNDDGVGYAERNQLHPDCDGLDNDCNGLIDDDPFFDADDDGYTYCGTCPPGGSTSCERCASPPPNGTTPWLCAEEIDCDDSNENVNPGMVEDCRTPIDDDCRCDHDDPDHEESVLGLPSFTAPGVARCTNPASSLDCALQERAGPNPWGNCSDDSTPQGAVDPYYYGAVNNNCHYCDIDYGRTCNDETGACTSRAEICEGNCDMPSADPAVVRPLCCSLAPATCTGTTPPAWVCPVFAESLDPFSECPPPVCNQAVNGNGPYYHGVVDTTPADGRDNPLCFFKANGVGVCDGGECASRASECAVAPMGEADTSRPVCARPRVDDTTCTGTTPPIYEGVDVFDDPYNECGGLGCNGFDPPLSGCLKDQGESCQTPAECRQDPSNPGKHLACADNVCCNEACEDTCWACTSALTASANGICAVIDVVAEDNYPEDTCTSDGYGCTGSNCRCYPNAGECRRHNGQSCSQSNQCASGFCVDGYCCNEACDQTCRACSAALTASPNGTCAVFDVVADDVAPTNLCTGSVGCSGDECTCHPGSGQCRRDLGESCTVGNQCASGFCVDGVCCNTSCLGECHSCASGTCEPSASLDGSTCGSGEFMMCCGGDCVNPPGTGMTNACGTGSCASTWQCVDSAVVCGRLGFSCDVCEGDTINRGQCSAESQGQTCDLSVSDTQCPTCQHCLVSSGVGACVDVASGEDTVEPNLCTAPDTCTDGTCG